MYIDNFRDFAEEDTSLDEASIYEIETQALPYGCPYRQMFPVPPFFGGQGPESQYGPPGFQNPQGGPSTAPPSFTPPQPQQASQSGPSLYAVDPGAIRPCTYRFVYIWPRRGRGFWAWLTFVGRRSVSGFRWNGHTWRYFGMDLRNIESFQCY